MGACWALRAVPDRRQARVEPLLGEGGEQRLHGGVEVGQVPRLVEQRDAVRVGKAQAAAGPTDPLRSRHGHDPLGRSHLVEGGLQAGGAQIERQQAHGYDSTREGREAGGASAARAAR